MQHFAPRLREGLGGLLTALCAVSVFLFLNGLRPGYFYHDDAQLTFGPGYVENARAWLHGEIPLLSPYCWHAANISGMYQYGSLSLFHQALVLLAVLTGDEPNRCLFIMAVYAGVAAWGFYLLGRGWEWPPFLAWSAALCATLNGWTIFHDYAEWQSHAASFAPLPWLWWSLESRQSSLPQRLANWVSLYAIWTGGFYLPVLMSVLLLGQAIVRRLVRRDYTRLLELGLACTAAAGASFPSLLLLLIHAFHGIRPSGAYTAGRLHPLFLLTGLMPCRNWFDLPNHLPDELLPWTLLGSSELVGFDYGIGFFPLFALLLALLTHPLRLVRRTLPVFLVAAAAFTLACLPSFGGAQHSSRWCQLLLPCMALLGAEALQLLNHNEGLKRRMVVAVIPIAFVPLAKSALVHSGVEDSYALNQAWPGMVLALVWVLSWAGLPRLRLQVISGAAVAITICTLACQGPDHPMNLKSAYFIDAAPQARPALRLDPKRLYLTLYDDRDYVRFDDSLRYWDLYPGNRAMAEGVQVMNGFDSTEPRPLSESIEMETGGTLKPDFCRGCWAEAGDGQLLDHWGVDGLIVASRFEQECERPLKAKGWDRVADIHGVTLWHRRRRNAEWSNPTTCRMLRSSLDDGFETMVHKRGEGVSIFGPDQALPLSADTVTKLATLNVTHFENRRNEASADVEAQSGERSLLVLRRAYCYGYRATLDGRPVVTGLYDGANLAVMLPPGARGHLEIRFLPMSPLMAVAIYLLSFALGLILSRTSSD